MNIKSQKIKRKVLKKLKLKNEKPKKEDRNDEEVAENEEDESELDSDEELQLAFARKQLKPGLNIAVDAPKVYKNDTDALKRKLVDFYLNMDWIERMDVSVEAAEAAAVKSNLTEDGVEADVSAAAAATDAQTQAKKEAELVNDDFKRESSFMMQAKRAAEIGLARLVKLGVPTHRPDDYFAEMVKPDEHMKKVRENLLSKHADIERREKVRKLRELKKMGKQIQLETEKRKLEAKKSFNESVKKFKRGEKDDLNIELEHDDNIGESATNKKKLADKNGIKKKGKKAQFKDQKYGYGGRKKRSKYNTAESYAEGYKVSQKKQTKFGGSHSGGGSRGGRGGGGRGGSNKPKKR